MSDTIAVLIYLSIVLHIVCGFVGYIVGRKHRDSQAFWESPLVFNSNKSQNYNQSSKPKIIIDESKFVTDISIDGIEKKYNQLGETKMSSENITSSVDKLKNLKR